MMSGCSQDHFVNVKDKFIATVEQIRQEYRHQIGKLKEEVGMNNQKICQLEMNIKKKGKQIDQLTDLNLQLQQKVLYQQTVIDTLQRQKLQFYQKNQIKTKQQEQYIDKLLQMIKDKEIEIRNIKNQQNFSVDQSIVSFQNNSQQQFSIQISQLFKNSPQEILKFLKSIEGEQSTEIKQKGDMTCMFVSRDGLSLDKFDNINRTFLKRKIKQNEKRFRFVLIHKPDYE